MYSYVNGRPARRPWRMVLGFSFGNVIRDFINRFRVNLTWGLVISEVELFLNLTLPASQLLKTVFALKFRPDFFAQFLGALLRVSNVQRETFHSLIKTLHGGLQ